MKKKKTISIQAAVCPCGSGDALAACCGRYHAGEFAPDAGRLMRSRYSAYVLGLEAYLLATWHASTRPAELNLSQQDNLKWMGLEVLSILERADRAEVAFIARYKLNGRAERMKEVSRFVRESGRWFYVDGDIRED